MEIIAFASGKGGTGKTLMASCLGYALVRAKQRVLLVDADPATDGLSLFLLGTHGTRQIGTFDEANTFVGILRRFRETETIEFQPRRINRSESNELGGHGVIYEVLISGRGMYGDESANAGNPAVPDLDQATFRRAISEFFHRLRASSEYDYVVVDTRGGFAFESTDVCALADSFIIVTEPDFTSFYQDRNLYKRISASADQLTSRPLLRSMIVNKATEGEATNGRIDLTKLEHSFRLELEKEFPLKFADTHPVPVDIEALKAYKTQRMPYLTSPASSFAFATLSAFRDIFQLVTNKWSEEQVKEWNVLIETVSGAISERNAKLLKELDDESNRSAEVVELRKRVGEQQEKIERLKKEEERLEEVHKREVERAQALLSSAATQTDRITRRPRLRYAIFGFSGFLVALMMSYLFQPTPIPLKVYIVTDAQTNDGSLSKSDGFGPIRSLRIGNRLVEPQVIVVPDTRSSSSTAAELANRADTLIVVGELNSQSVEASLPIFLNTRPQVPFLSTVATDDNLLAQCGEGCYDGGFAPLLQLSPTNEVQGQSAVRFASESNRRHFLIVSSNDPRNQSYDENMVKAYSDAIEEFHAELVGISKTDAFPSVSDLRMLRPDCILYVGGMGEAEVLLERLSSYLKPRPMVILADSALAPGDTTKRGGISSSYDPDPVYIMSATSAVDYNQHYNAALQDSLLIVAQLVGDVNRRGTDFRFRLRSSMGVSSVNDARRNLVRVMQEDLASRSVFYGAQSEYVFRDSKRVNGAFHVFEWRRDTGDMMDVDHWHPPLKGSSIPAPPATR
jgi:MinD-like ATPase involved in chromosome partitioning or flagellar assembly